VHVRVSSVPRGNAPLPADVPARPRNGPRSGPEGLMKKSVYGAIDAISVVIRIAMVQTHC